MRHGGQSYWPPDQGTVSRCCGLPFNLVKNIWFGCCAPGSFMTVCGNQGRLYMHSADPVELHWPWKAPWGRRQVNVCKYMYQYITIMSCSSLYVHCVGGYSLSWFLVERTVSFWLFLFSILFYSITFLISITPLRSSFNVAQKSLHQ